MNWNIDFFIKLLVWIIAIFIFLGVFNSSQFFCEHSIFWRNFFTLCSVVSIAEGFVAVVFIAISIDFSLKRTALYLSVIILLLIVMECVRVGGIEGIMQIIVSYSWKILGVFLGVGISKNRLNRKKYLLSGGLSLLLLGVWQEQINLGIIKLFLWLISFILIAFLIKQIRSSLLLKY
jgi:hypothetical protein